MTAPRAGVVAALLLLLAVPTPVAARLNDSVVSEDSNFARMQGLYLRQGVERYETNEGNRLDRTSVPFRIAYGVLHNLEVGADLPYLIYSGSSSGLGDIRLYQKYKFTEEDASTPALAGGLALYLPTGDEDKQTGTGKAAFELYGVGLRTIDRFTINLHLAYRFQGNSRYDNIFRYDLAVKTPLDQFARGISAVAELNGSKGDWEEVYLTPALLWEPREDFSVGLGIQIGLTKDSYDYGTVLRVGHDF